MEYILNLKTVAYQLLVLDELQKAMIYEKNAVRLLAPDGRRKKWVLLTTFLLLNTEKEHKNESFDGDSQRTDGVGSVCLNVFVLD